MCRPAGERIISQPTVTLWRHPMITRRTFLALAVPAALAVSAIAGGGTAAANGAASHPARSQAVRITGLGLTMPAVVAGPVIDLTIRNGDRIARELAVARVVPGTTLDQVMAAAAAGGDDQAPWFIADPGGIFVLGAGEQVRYQRQLQPGTYVFHAVLGDGTHDSPGQYQVVRITSSGRHELPEAERSIRLGDTGITLPRLTAGTHRYAITNTGTTPHEVFIVGVHDPADLDHADEIGAWLEGGQVGPPPVPVHFPGSHQTIDPGVTVVLTLDLHRATTYAFVDFQTGATAIGATR
jgi:hypothetical protein